MMSPFPMPGRILLALVLLTGCGAVVPPNGGGDSPPPPPPPPPPASRYVTLNWKASNDAARYNVYRSVTSGGYYGLIGSTANLNLTDSNVDSGATYYYVCTAVDSSGRESKHSNEARVTIP